MKHRIRRALMAAAVLASTLVTGVVIAPPAHATTYYTNTYTNLAQIAASTETNDSSLPSFPVGSYHAYQCAGATFNPTITDLCDTAQNQTPGSSQRSGGSATLKLKAIYFSTNGDFPTCNGSVDNPDKVRVEIHNSSGTQIGSTDWEYTLGSSGFGPCDNTDQTSKTVYLDNDPLDNDNADGALTPGSYAIYLKFLDTDGTDNANSSGVDSLGAHGNGPNDSESVIKGTFTVTPAYTYLNGSSADGNSASELAAAEADQGAAAATKNFSLVRDFSSSWGNPGSRARTWASEGKAVVWSTKPKGSGVAYTCTQNGGAIEECTGTSPWDQSAADGTDSESLRSMIQTLQDNANDYSVPFMGFAISHEPHDDAAIVGNGHSSGKCGTTTDAGADPSGSNIPCFGTALDFKGMYTAMRARQQDSCDVSGGITGTGYPCTKVKIMYIGVGSNMYDDGSGQNVVGDGDLLRPASADYDLLGADTYNYSCFTDMPKQKTDGVISGGTTLTSATFSFATGDVGDPIRGTGIPAGTTISARASSTSVTLSQASTNGSALTFEVYNDGVCSQSKWESFEEVVDDTAASLDDNGERLTVLGLARYLDKKVILAEYASHPGCNGVEYGVNEGCYGSSTDDINGDYDRATWFTAMHTWLTTDTDPINYLVGFAYFHSSGTDQSRSDHDWRFLPANNHASDPAYLYSGSDGRSAWQGTMGTDTNFLSTAVGYSLVLDPTP